MNLVLLDVILNKEMNIAHFFNCYNVFCTFNSADYFTFSFCFFALN